MQRLILALASLFCCLTTSHSWAQCDGEGYVLSSAELRLALSEASASERYRATKTMSGLGCGHEALVLPALASPYRDVRLAAVQAVGNCPTDATMSMLRTLLRNDKQDRYVRIAICETLGDLRDASAFGVLDTLAMSTDDSEVRNHAIQASARIAQPGFDSPRIHWNGEGVVLAFLRDDVVGAYLDAYYGGRHMDIWSPAEIDTLLCLLSLSRRSDSLRGCSLMQRYKLVLLFRDKHDVVFESDGHSLAYSSHVPRRQRSGGVFSTRAEYLGAFLGRMVERLEAGDE